MYLPFVVTTPGWPVIRCVVLVIHFILFSTAYIIYIACWKCLCVFGSSLLYVSFLAPGRCLVSRHLAPRAQLYPWSQATWSAHEGARSINCDEFNLGFTRSTDVRALDPHVQNFLRGQCDHVPLRRRIRRSVRCLPMAFHSDVLQCRVVAALCLAAAVAQCRNLVDYISSLVVFLDCCAVEIECYVGHVFFSAFLLCGCSFFSILLGRTTALSSATSTSG